MMNQRSSVFTVLVIFFLLVAAGVSQAVGGERQSVEPVNGSFELKDGDRVVFVGGTFWEHAQEYGYVELALTTRWPDRTVTFRNLGWSGDTVYGEARGHYTNPPTAYEHLVEQVVSTKPTVIMVGYGANLAYEGKEARSRFKEGLNRLLDDLADTTGARMILLSPPPHEAETSPAPQVNRYNNNLQKTSALVEQVAGKRGYPFIDLFEGLRQAMKKTDQPLTDNGIYLNAAGYYRAAAVIEKGFGWPARQWKVSLDLSTGEHKAVGAAVKAAADQKPAGFTAVSDRLLVPSPLKRKVKQRRVVANGLPKGRYKLLEGRRKVAEASAQKWAKGVAIAAGAENQRAERLRKLIVQKNQLYFYRYRPQNETYLVGFREYEQGQNASELEQFKPLIDEKELEIGWLRQPQTHRYQLVQTAK